jgi:hypothetical protein
MPKCTTPWLASHSVAATLTPEFSVAVFLARKGSFVMAGTEQHGAALRHFDAGLLHRRLEIGRRDLGARRDVAQVDADAGHDAFLQRILSIGWPVLSKCLGASIWVPA